MLKKRIISIVLCAAMTAGQFSFASFAASQSFNNINLVVPPEAALPSVGSNGFINELSSPLPEIGADGFVIRPEEALPGLQLDKTGFIREPEIELPSAEPGVFFIEPSEDLPTQQENGFIKKLSIPLPEKSADGFINSPDIPLVKSGSNGFIENFDGYIFTGKESGFLKPIPSPDENATVITTAEQLASMTSGSYVLANDIDLSSYNGGNWIPVEPHGDIVFDGQGHKILNMTSDDSTYNNCSLFMNYNYFSDYPRYDLTVKNVGFETTNGSVIGTEKYRGAAIIENFTGLNLVISNCYNLCNVIGYGGLVGISKGENTIISDSYNKGKITGFAGIIGNVQSGSIKISECFNNGTVTTTFSDAEVGGIIAAVSENNDTEYSAEIINCSNFARISGTYTTGGIIGEFTDRNYNNSSTALIIKNCCNKGAVTGKYAVGGIIAYSTSDNISIENCYNTGVANLSSSTPKIYCAGIIGYSTGVTGISKSYNNGKVVLSCSNKVSENSDISNCASGILAYCPNSASITDCFNTGIIIGTAHYGLYTAGISAYGISNIKRCYNTGNITAKEIGTTNLHQVRLYAAGISAYANTNVSDCYNTAKTDSYEYSAGITTYANEGKYSNCFNTGNAVGKYAAGITIISPIYNNKEITNVIFEECANSGTITAEKFAAGIVYCNSMTNIQALRCLNEGEITAESAAGIIKIDNIKTEESEVYKATSCINTGNIVSDYDGAGIFSEETQITQLLSQTAFISDCINTGVITWGNGIMTCSVGTITNCVNSGEIMYGSGLFSDMYGSAYYCCNTAKITGGCGLGYSLKSQDETESWLEMGDDGEWIEISQSFCDEITGELTECFNSGEIIGSAGLLMRAGSLNVERCYNTGNINSSESYDGPAGLILTVDAAESFYITDCYNSGNITSLAYTFDGEAVGGLIGYLGVADNARVENCYNTGNISHDEGSSNTVLGGLIGAVSVSEYANFYNETILSAHIENCYNSGNITANGKNYTIGGILGLNHDISGSGTILTCINLGDIVYTSGVAGGIAGECDMDAKYCVNAGAMSYTAGNDETIMVGVFKEGGDIISCLLNNVENAYKGAAFALTCRNIDNCYYTFALTGNYINGALAGQCENITDCYYMGDITLNGDTEYFGGLAGKANSVTNSFFIGDIDVSTTSEFVNFGGIVGECTDALACVYSGNMTGYSSDVYSSVKIGGIAGKTDSVKRCQTFGSMYTDSKYAVSGGLAAHAMTAMNCKSHMDMEIHTTANKTLNGVDACASGGIIGIGAIVIYNCTNTGDILSSIYAGGITGYTQDVNINSCINTGNVTITNKTISTYAGGICARAINFNCSNCINTGNVTTENDENIYPMCGGMSGYVQSGSVRSCINRGDVFGHHAAGIVYGYVESITDCINYGDVTSPDYFACGIGLKAYAKNCVNHGNISGTYAWGIGNEKAVYCLNDGSVSGMIVYGITSEDATGCINSGNLYAEGSYKFEFIAVAIGKNAKQCINTGEIYCDTPLTTSVDIYGICNVTATDCYNGGYISVSNTEGTSGTSIYGIGLLATNCINDAKIDFSAPGGVGIYGISERTAVNCKNNGDITIDKDGVSISDETSHPDCFVIGISKDANNCYNNGNITITTPHEHDEDSVYGVGLSASYCKNNGNIIVESPRKITIYGVATYADRSDNHGYIKADGKTVYASGIGSSSAQYCTNYGTVYAEGETVYAGGIGSYGNSNGIADLTVTNCENKAPVTAYGNEKAYAGGILAYSDSSFANCTNSGSIMAHCRGNTQEDTLSAAGGIIGFACGGTESWWGTPYSDKMVLENCHNTGRISATAFTNGDNNIARAHAGGLIGDMFKTEIGMNMGLPIYSYTLMFVDDSCTNSGSTSAYSSTADYYALSGNIYGHGKVYTGSDAYPDSVYITGQNMVEINKTITLTAHIIPSFAFFDGVNWSTSDASVLQIEDWDREKVTVKGVSKGKATITATTQNGIVAEHVIDVLDNRINVTVMGYERFKENEAYPLDGATVTIGAVTQTTDQDGKTVFERGDLPQGSTASIKISAGEDYSEEDTVIGLVASSYSVNHTYHLRKKDYVILVDSAEVIIDHVRHNLISAPGMKYIPALESDGSINTEEYEFNVKIDWGKFEDNVSSRKVWLESATAKIQIKEGKNSIAFAKHFKLKETIKVVAETKNSSGETVTGEYVLPLKTQVVKVDLTPEPSDSFDLGPIYFLDGLDLKLGIENFGHAADFELKDGVLKLEFGKDRKENITKNLKLGLFENKNESKVSVTGFVSIPVNDIKNGEWEGGVKVEAGVSSKTSTDRDDGKNGFELFAHKHDFFIGTVPVFIDVNLKGGGSGQLSILGTFNKPYFRGTLEGFAQAEIFGGIGGEVFDDCQFKFGPSGNVKATVPMTFEAKSLEDASFTFDPSVTGRLDIRMFVKLFDVIDIDEKLDLGHFKLDKNGFKTHLDEEKGYLTALSEIDFSNAPVKVAGRDYLKNGGGFNGETAILLGDSDSSRVINTVYENIIECADAELTFIDGKPVLIFSMDNTERDTYNALNAVYSVYNNGIWTVPASIDDDGTIDSGISASGKFVVWEDTGNQINSSNTLSEALAMTDISAGVWDGEKFVTYTLTNDSVYDFGAKVADYDGKAIAAWISNTAADCTAMSGENSICYSIFDGNEWSEVQSVANAGRLTNINVLYNENGAYIVYKDASLKLNRINAQTGDMETYIENVGRYVIGNINSSTVLADIDAENELNICIDGNTVKTVKTNFNGSANPIMCTNGEYTNIFWTENDGIYYVSGDDSGWSDKLCFKNDTATIGNLDCIIDHSGEFVLTYMRTENNVTDLVTVTAAPGADIVVENISYDGSTYTGEGRFDYSITLKNNGEKAADGCSVYLYDNKTQISVVNHDDMVILPSESKIITGSAELSSNFAKDKHTYTLEVTCDGDFDTSNNSLSIDVGTVDAELLDATFEVNEVGTESLVIMVRNNGDVDIDNTKITVRKNSKNALPIYEFSTAGIPVGGTGIFNVPEKQDENAVYYVSVSATGDKNDSNNIDCVAYERVVQNPPVSYDFNTGIAKVIIDSNTTGETGKIVATLYDADLRVKKVNIADIVSGQTEYSFLLPDASAGDTIKVMVFENLESVSPKAPATVWIIE